MTSLADGRHLVLKHPFTAMIAGPTGCGKSVLVRRLLTHYDAMTSIVEPVLHVLHFHGQVQQSFKDEISPRVKVRYVHVAGTKDFATAKELIVRFRPHIVIVDDLMQELGGDAQLANLFTKNSHHMRFSVIFVLQNIFHKAREVRNLSLNSHYLFVFKNPRDRSQIDHLARQILPSNIAAFREIHDDATRDPYGYLLIDCTPDTPEALRFRAKCTPEETVKGAPPNAMVCYSLES